ncbi:MAG: hypothetical protein KDK53_22595 [Maritimibacter sp.]|nr:hypothetical protein [Maritimibacter sp.]
MKTKTFQDLIDEGQQDERKTTRQYAKHLERCIQMFADVPRDILRRPVDLALYLAIAPKFSKKKRRLVRAIEKRGMRVTTYKQYQADGRRMIETYTGELAERLALRERDDGWAAARARLVDLASANLVREESVAQLAKITSIARSQDIDVGELTRDKVIALRDHCGTSDDWTKVKSGARTLDKLREFPTLLDLLPATEIGDLSKVFRFDCAVPAHLEREIDEWIQSATKTVPDLATEQGRDMATDIYADGTIGIYVAAFRKYVGAAGRVRDLAPVNGMFGLMSPVTAEKIVVKLVEETKRPGGLSPRSLFSYIDKIRLTLESRGHLDEAHHFKALCNSLPVLIEGREAGRFMAPGVQEWCETLLLDPKRLALFETQHLHYAEHAREALSTARAVGIDLKAFAAGAALDADQVPVAKKLLRRARMFGVCAAFAAIELEGAPYRKSNTLALEGSGRLQTFFDHSSAAEPYFEIRIPNELLKNGEAMTKRQQSLPPSKFVRGEEGCFGFDILEFYLREIRPLFGGHTESDFLFPAIEPVAKHLVVQTFDGWLGVCSSEVGITLTAHNYRHGFASVEINEDPTCFETLSMVTGDSVSVLRKHYAFILRERHQRTMQSARAARRRSYASGQAFRSAAA